MNLLQTAGNAPGWDTATATEFDSTKAFVFPYLGDPHEHSCTNLRSRRATASVVLATWNSSHSLRRCLESLELSSLNRADPGRLEVIVCDDGSSDDTWAALCDTRRNLNVTALRLEHRGQSFAINAGIDRAGGDVVIVCDSDMLLGCGALDEMLARHELWPDAVCFGFRTDVAPDQVPDEPNALLSLMHTEAVTGDTRLRFHMPTIVTNMLVVSEWLTRLDCDRHILDCEGSVWRRHRFLFGCLFSARRDLLTGLGGMPEAVPRWGYQDTLVAAALEAHGGFLLPVTTAWGHHVSHQIRHADQWFQYHRNRLAYEHILDQNLGDAPWRLYSRRPSILARDVGRAAVPTPRADQPIAASPGLNYAFGRWEDYLASSEEQSDDLMRAECLYRTLRYDELIDGGGHSFWRAAALARRGQAGEARLSLEHAPAFDTTAAYVRSASVAELRRLSRHHRCQQFAQVTDLYECAVHLADRS